MDVQTLAAIVERVGQPFSMVNVELAECLGTEVLVEIVATGICHTDLAIRDGDFPMPNLPGILGHEGAGRVISTGDRVTKVQAGDHVVISFSSCGSCSSCSIHQPARCTSFVPLNFGGARADGSFVHSRNGEDINGSFFGQSSFARHAVVPERNIVKVPTDLPLALLGPLGCGIQTGAGTVLNHIKPKAGASIAIFGAGAVGLSAIMASKIAGCSPIIAVDLQQGRLDLARELGATHLVNPTQGDAAQSIHAIVEGGVQHVVECSGASIAVETAFQIIAQGASVSLVGVPRAEAVVSVPHLALMSGVTQTVCEGDSDPETFIPLLIEHYRAGRLPFDKFVTFYPFEDINRAIADAESGAAIKPVLMISKEASI
jgi:aryl-alcohol dehydrogenase